MNKDKIIKDLKERNDKLANQYRLRDIRCVHLEIENERLQQENKQLKEENQKLYERLFKARKMIFDNYGVLDKYQIEMLEDILKGEEILGDKE